MVPILNSDSELDFPILNENPGDKDATTIFCGGKLSEERNGELWVQCVMCSIWEHNECSGAHVYAYICDFCKYTERLLSDFLRCLLFISYFL